MKKLLLSLLLLGFVFTLGVSVYSQTPDEMTPAIEDVCDGLEGAAYGLCNAYCEALDCNGEGYEQHTNACDKIHANFDMKTDGAPMPCLDPCATVECGDNEVCIDGQCCIDLGVKCIFLKSDCIIGANCPETNTCELNVDGRPICCPPPKIECPDI